MCVYLICREVEKDKAKETQKRRRRRKDFGQNEEAAGEVWEESVCGAVRHVQSVVSLK